MNEQINDSVLIPLETLVSNFAEDDDGGGDGIIVINLPFIN